MRFPYVVYYKLTYLLTYLLTYYLFFFFFIFSYSCRYYFLHLFIHLSIYKVDNESLNRDLSIANQTFRSTPPRLINICQRSLVKGRSPCRSSCETLCQLHRF